MKKVALVTGASSGFGLEIAKKLQGKDYRVFGTSRKVAKRDDFEMIQLDVRQDNSVMQAVDYMLETAGHIDLLVNNAGVLLGGAAEENSLEEVQELFQNNFFGVVRMTNAVLPHMRSKRYGRIINIGSLAGLIGTPGEAFYSASKFALEGYSEALQYELEPLGIKMVLIEPGFFRTNLKVTLPVARIPDYDVMRSSLQKHIEQSMQEGGDPAEVARLVTRVATIPSPKLRYKVGKFSSLAPFLKAFIPERMFTQQLKKQFGLLVHD